MYAFMLPMFQYPRFQRHKHTTDIHIDRQNTEALHISCRNDDDVYNAGGRMREE